jgi:hypothetical protein
MAYSALFKYVFEAPNLLLIILVYLCSRYSATWQWHSAPFKNTEFWLEICAGIFKQSMGARNRVGIGLLYQPARLHRLAEVNPWNRFLGYLNVQNFGLCYGYPLVISITSCKIQMLLYACNLC